MDFSWAASLGSAAPQGYGLAVLLVSLRLGAMLLLTPVLYALAMPATVRVLLIVGLAAALAAGLPATAELAARLADPGALLAACASELALGALLAFGIFVAFAAISMAGRMMDVQIGFGIAQVFDPVTRRQVPVLSSAFDHVGVLVFFLADGHHALLRAAALTLERFPPGRPWPLAAAAPMVMQQAGALFGLGFALAAPVVVGLLLVDLAMGVVARNLPQFNMFALGIPVKIVLGLAMLALWFAGMGDAMTRTWTYIFRSWDAGLAAMSAAMPAAGAR
ncbi:MAG TPA: flagellar biosynthetic protein FliR [Ramlibacter sp.]|uniref:flagellar biosynthetic protein FliR n=1 Tax=Ramlibacter sp. TaxID=1917967 RepID=UPI002BC9965B|nr:flagellar biosynthetic protein FliR [Ramlibacter sp.]HVZ46134.1 flagellar biosynthetic protein FliR [Ramlibacter sp.]